LVDFGLQFLCKPLVKQGLFPCEDPRFLQCTEPVDNV
jgi:hypothetical protein